MPVCPERGAYEGHPFFLRSGVTMIAVSTLAGQVLLLGYGYSKLTMLLNVARVFAFRVPVLWYLRNYTGMGAEAVGVTMMVINVCVGIMAVIVAIPVILIIRRLIREEE